MSQKCIECKNFRNYCSKNIYSVVAYCNKAFRIFTINNKKLSTRFNKCEFYEERRKNNGNF